MGSDTVPNLARSFYVPLNGTEHISFTEYDSNKLHFALRLKETNPALAGQTKKTKILMSEGKMSKGTSVEK